MKGGNLLLIFQYCFRPTARIFDGLDGEDTLYYDYDAYSEDTLYYSSMGGKMIRNTRDSSFYPGSRHAGVRGITKDMLGFIHNVVSMDTFRMWIQRVHRQQLKILGALV